MTRWLNTTQIPLPYPLRTWLLDSFIGFKLARAKLESANVELDLDLADALQSNIYLNHYWEVDLSNWAAFFAARSRTIADIGAQIGYFTVLMSRYCQPDSIIYAFEPNPRSFEQLKRNIALNHMVVEILPIAITDTLGQANLNLPHRFQLGAARLSKLSHPASTITVETTNLDAYCASQGLDGLDLIKMDIEGGELQALQGMIDGLKTGVYGVLLVEFHQTILTSTEAQTVLDLLNSANYRVFEIHPARLVMSKSIGTSDFCAISPHAYRDLGSPNGDIRLPEIGWLPYPLARGTLRTD